MSDIYTQHDAAFARVSAFVILDAAGEKIATVAIKFPADGAGRLWAYVHVIGAPMTRGSADGYGYDKRSPAVALALKKAAYEPAEGEAPNEYGAKIQGRIYALREALGDRDGEYWDARLTRAGFQVLGAV
jgi:hypothetical protein